MLQRRLIAPVLVAGGVLSLAACGDKSIEEGLARPAVTALQEARSTTCAANRNALQTAIETYTMLEGEPPTDEAALIEAGFLREATTDWDVVDGEIVPQDGSGC